MKVFQELTGLPLMRYGFVHVTGLPVNRGDNEESRITADPQQLGRYDYNNGVDVMVTLDGEVWIRHASDNKATRSPEFGRLREKLCPKGKGVFVPCSNGEAVPSYMILSRVSDPYWIGYEGKYRFSFPQGQVTSVQELADPVIVRD